MFLRPLTPGSVSYFSCQIPTLPIMIAPYLHLGGACPPHWVFQGFVVLGPVSGGNGGWGGGGGCHSVTLTHSLGGGIAHPRLQHWVKWLWERVWDFSALGGPTSSVSIRVVKLTISHYYSAPLPLQKRGYGDEIRNPVVFMIPSTGSRSGVGGCGMHNGCDFWN